MPNFDGQVVVVTGAAGRLGQRMVEAFARHGATLAAVDLNAEAVAWPHGAPGHTFSADLTDEAGAERLFQEIERAFGRVDAVVHTVGGWAGQPLRETSLADFRRLLDVNLTSTFLCFREAARLMGSGGRLIAMASGQGADQGKAGQYAYSAAKAGVIRLVEAVADEYEQVGLTAHAIAPSTILFEDEDLNAGVHARDIVDLALYLCSPAGAALNGGTVRAYGTAR